jgi:hypothetical protein
MCMKDPPTKFEWTLELIAKIRENQNKQRNTLCQMEIALRHKEAGSMTGRELEKMRERVRRSWSYNPNMS